MLRNIISDGFLQPVVLTYLKPLSLVSSSLASIDWSKATEEGRVAVIRE